MKTSSKRFLQKQRDAAEKGNYLAKELAKLFERYRAESHHMNQDVLDTVGAEANRIVKRTLGQDIRVVVEWDPANSEFKVRAGATVCSPDEI